MEKIHFLQESRISFMRNRSVMKSQMQRVAIFEDVKAISSLERFVHCSLAKIAIATCVITPSVECRFGSRRGEFYVAVFTVTFVFVTEKKIWRFFYLQYGQEP